MTGRYAAVTQSLQDNLVSMVRVAFLVGNKTYTRNDHQTNWWEDVSAAFRDVDVAYDLLEERGFDCEAPMKDATACMLRLLPGCCAEKLRNTFSSLCLWLYSGHGMTFAGRLYLIATDFALTVEKFPFRTLVDELGGAVSQYPRGAWCKA